MTTKYAGATKHKGNATTTTNGTEMTLRELEIGKTAIITSVGGEGSLRQHFLNMGLIPGAEVTLVKYAPMGDPMQLKVQGYELTLRLSDAKKIEVIESSRNESPEDKNAEGNYVPTTKTYKVVEKKGEDSSVTYDTRTYDVTVTLEDDGKGKITATADPKENTYNFKNTRRVTSRRNY